MGFSQITTYVKKNWINVASYAGLFAGLALLLVWRLNSMLPGYAPEEVAAYSAAVDWRHWLDNPFNLPYLIAVKVLSLIITDSFIVTRLVSVIFGLVTLVIFSRLLWVWQDMRTSIVGTLLLGISPWFLHIARFGSPEVLSFGVFTLVACAFWAKQSKHWLPLAITLISLAVCLYMPGMIWFVLFGIFWQWRNIARILRGNWLTVGLATLVISIILVPIIWAFIAHPSLIPAYLGLPQNIPNIFDILNRIILFPYHLLIHAPQNAVMWLGQAPYLDAFSTAMFVLGGYLYLRQFKLGRTPVFLTVILLTLVLSSIGNYVSFNIILPFIYVLIAVGTSYLFDTWFIVFPVNPIARVIGIGLLSAALAIVCFYSLNHYFVGWPSASATSDAYSLFQKP